MNDNNDDNNNDINDTEKKDRIQGPLQVEAIMNRKEEQGKLYYYIKWKDYSMNKSTWEPIDHFTKGRELIKEWDKLYEERQMLLNKKKPDSNDKPLKIIAFELDANKDLYFTIEWKEREDHSKADNSIYSREWIIDNCSELLVDFYERHIVIFD